MRDHTIEPPERFRTWVDQVFQITSSHGTLTYLIPKHPIEDAPYCITFPGYTGDALSQESFIVAALTSGFAILCVTPKWSESVRRIEENIRALKELSPDLPIKDAQPYFVRGVSFGCDLSLTWLSTSSRSPEKIAWITPCSARQLPDAGKAMGLRVVHDSETISYLCASPVQVMTLTKDAVVPEADRQFLLASPQTVHSQVNGSDHVEAGNLPNASSGVARWFKVAYEK